MSSGTEMEPGEILSKCSDIGHIVICLTGGEPLLKRPDIPKLITDLIQANFLIVVETNGSVSLTNYVPFRKYHSSMGETYVNRISFVVDYKLGSTGETTNASGKLGTYGRIRFS